MKLLVADDELSTRIFLRHCASKWGYEVVEASDGLEAMSFLRCENPPRIAVLDWMMPGLDGVEICSRLHEQTGRPMIYAILLTSRTDKDDLMHALDHGAHDFLSKPVHIGELHSRIAVGRRLVEANDRLFEMDRQKDSFMRIAANGLRNPLEYIITMTEMLGDDKLSEIRRNMDAHLRIIHETAVAMQALVSDLLAASMTRKETISICRQRASIADLIRHCLRLQQQAAESKHIALSEQLSAIPDFCFDPGRICQVVGKLLNNAVKLSPPGSTVAVALEADGKEVRVSVSDQGPWLTPEDLPQLCGDLPTLPAQSGSCDKSAELGLASKIVELHGGTMWTENRAGAGRVFSFALPIL